MLRLRQFIEITQQPTATQPLRNLVLYFDFCTEIEIERSFDSLTQKGKFVIPRNLKYQDKNLFAGADPLIQRGDKIKISMGYAPNLKEEFNGYISRITADIPIEIEFEDQMWVLKQTETPTAVSYNNKTLKFIIDDLIRGKFETKVIDTSAGISLRMYKCNVGNVLEKLRSEFGFYSFFVNQVLYVGLAFYPVNAISQTFLFEQQVVDNDLQYLRTDDIKVKIKGVLINNDNSRETIEVGDTDGDLRTVHQYGGTLEQLKFTCNQKLTEYHYNGYVGSFTTFLEPSVTVGDYAVMASYAMPERNGTYLIKSVKKGIRLSGSPAGYQTISLERRIA